MNKVLILGYHRIADATFDPYAICVAPQHFVQHLEVLRKHGQPIRLRELTRMLCAGHVPRRAIVVTFDDGYADNLYNARPLLERYEIPATVFVTTGTMGGEFWWDELFRILMSPEILPDSLRLTINGKKFTWDLGRAAQKIPAGIVSKARREFALSVYWALRHFSEEEQQEALNDLWTWSGTERSVSPFYRSLSSGEVIRLSEGGLVEIGAHTVTHPILADLPLARQRFEIGQSKAVLEDILGDHVTSFSYPNGSFSSETEAIVGEAGFLCACGNVIDIVWRESNRFHLPRFWVGDWDGETFSRHLKRWLGG